MPGAKGRKSVELVKVQNEGDSLRSKALSEGGASVFLPGIWPSGSLSWVVLPEEMRFDIGKVFPENPVFFILLKALKKFKIARCLFVNDCNLISLMGKHYFGMAIASIEKKKEIAL